MISIIELRNMNTDNFLIFNKIKNRASFWRMVSFLLLIILITLLSGDFNTKIFNKTAEEYSHDYIAKVKINGKIESTTFDESKLLELKNNDNIKAVILEIDSPGGEVVTSEILYNTFKEISQKKPVVTTIKSIGASGAYMIALASEYIVAYNTSLVGSIGVLVQSVNINNLLNKTGVDVKLYKSSKLKATPNLFELVDEDTEMVLKEQINEVYDYFLDIFIKSRKLDRKDAMEIANGQVYVGKQAINFDLIDKIGDVDDLLIYLKDKGVTTSKIFDYNIVNKDNFWQKMMKSMYKEEIINNKKFFFLYN